MRDGLVVVLGLFNLDFGQREAIDWILVVLVAAVFLDWLDKGQSHQLLPFG